MIDLRFRPLDKWPDELGKIRPAFKMSFTATLDLLEHELRKLGATNILIEAGFNLQQIRNDGWPHAGNTPAHPGVVLYFDSPEGPLRFPAANYSNWRANLHAIALTVENLRAIDRYGVTLTQQYAGFKMLEAAGDTATVLRAALTLAALSKIISADDILGDAECFRQAYSHAARQCHPDHGGRPTDWDDLQRAKTTLEAYYAATAV